MPNYRRDRSPGGVYFFTLVTYHREAPFLHEETRRCLRQAITEVMARDPFEITGICLLPDHLHTIWTLPTGDTRYSQRWNEIKGLFSKRSRKMPNVLGSASPSRSRQLKGEVTLWQRRFWEHMIRDESDLRSHMDYLHYNPVKHGHVRRVVDWPWSSFHRYVREGVYSQDWGGSTPAKLNLNTVGE